MNTESLIAVSLANLSKLDLARFRFWLSYSYRVPQSKVEKKDYMELANVLVKQFTEDEAPILTSDILRSIMCNQDAKNLDSQIAQMTSNASDGQGAGQLGNNRKSSNSIIKRLKTGSQKIKNVFEGRASERRPRRATVKPIVWGQNTRTDASAVEEEKDAQIAPIDEKPLNETPDQPCPAVDQGPVQDAPGLLPGVSCDGRESPEKPPEMSSNENTGKDDCTMAKHPTQEITHEKEKPVDDAALPRIYKLLLNAFPKKNAQIAPIDEKPLNETPDQHSQITQMTSNASDGQGVGQLGFANARKSSNSSGKHFVDKHRLQLIQRATNIDPILDALLDQEVLLEETYEEISQTAGNQNKMRKIYQLALKSGDTAKDVFMELLREKEPYLVKDLLKDP
ncbi:uncharacterized protein LOC144072652 [Stigmatopora argus]